MSRRPCRHAPAPLLSPRAHRPAPPARPSAAPQPQLPLWSRSSPHPRFGCDTDLHPLMSRLHPVTQTTHTHTHCDAHAFRKGRRPVRAASPAQPPATPLGCRSLPARTRSTHTHTHTLEEGTVLTAHSRPPSRLALPPATHQHSVSAAPVGVQWMESRTQTHTQTLTLTRTNTPAHSPIPERGCFQRPVCKHALTHTKRSRGA